MSTPGPDWYLQEWFATAEKKQADLVKELGMGKNTAFKLWHGTQPFNREYLNQIAAFLNIRPYELLLPPAEAMAIRGFREQAVRLATVSAPPMASTGT